MSTISTNISDCLTIDGVTVLAFDEDPPHETARRGRRWRTLCSKDDHGCWKQRCRRRGKRDLVGKTYTLTISGVTYNVPPNALTFIESPKEEGRSKIHEIAEEPVDRLPGTLDGEGCFSKRDRVNDIVKQLGVDIVAAINARN